jgi:hypothetical protein
MTASFIIETDRLTLDYKTVRVVDGLDLCIEGSELLTSISILGSICSISESISKKASHLNITHLRKFVILV